MRQIAAVLSISDPRHTFPISLTGAGGDQPVSRFMASPLLYLAHRQYDDDVRLSIVTRRLSSYLLAKVLLMMGAAALAHGALAHGALAHGAMAQGTQSLATIQGAAEQFVLGRAPASQGKLYVNAAALDPRLRLAACASTLEAFATTEASFSARITVGVRCTSNVQWTLYVPVAIDVEAPVLVLRRGLARRARIETTDVELQTRRLPGTLTNFVSDAVFLQGHRLKRALPAGAPLTVDVLAPDVLIRRGQKVTLVAANESIEIRAEGLALTEGGAADRVRVQNANSLKIVEGVVENASTVRVQL
jgi:flagella basal body P-ring formation protein FlgA